MKCSVVDLYSGDIVRDFSAAAANGLLGVIHKATQGNTYSDKTYASRRKQATDAGLLWGAYHFASNAPVADQVARFLAVAEPDGNTLLALDFEALPGKTMSVAQAKEWIGLIEEKTNRSVVIYSGNLIKEGLGNSFNPFFGARRLWLAQYGKIAQVQASWRNKWLWQYTDGTAGPLPHDMVGIPGDSAGNLDCNHYDGTAEQLRGEWSGWLGNPPVVKPAESDALAVHPPAPHPTPRPATIAELEEKLYADLPPEES